MRRRPGCKYSGSVRWGVTTEGCSGNKLVGLFGKRTRFGVNFSLPLAYFTLFLVIYWVCVLWNLMDFDSFLSSSFLLKPQNSQIINKNLSWRTFHPQRTNLENFRFKRTDFTAQVVSLNELAAPSFRIKNQPLLFSWMIKSHQNCFEQWHPGSLVNVSWIQEGAPQGVSFRAKWKISAQPLITLL